MNKTYIQESKLGGRGVFANEEIEAGKIIEFCPMLVMPFEDRKHVDETTLYDYYFEWGDDQRSLAIALGNGSIYNHDYDPNADYETYFEEKIMVIKARRNIAQGEEILISYNQDPEDRKRVWFEGGKGDPSTGSGLKDYPSTGSGPKE